MSLWYSCDITTSTRSMLISEPKYVYEEEFFSIFSNKSYSSSPKTFVNVSSQNVN